MTSVEDPKTVMEQQAVADSPEAVLQVNMAHLPSAVSSSAAGIQDNELLQKIKSFLPNFQTDFKANRSVDQEILRESKSRFSEIMGMVNHRLHQAEADRAKFEVETIQLRSDLSAATSDASTAKQRLQQSETSRAGLEAEIIELKNRLRNAQSEMQQALQQAAVVQKEKTDIENRLQAVVGEQQILEQEVAILKNDLLKANSLVETATADRNKFEKKLNQFQEQWDKFVVRG